jgi:disulfide bond formation protein DsbB
MSALGLPRIAFACFVLGLALVLLVEASIARIVGVPLIFVGIALGVTVIADPKFLERDREES